MSWKRAFLIAGAALLLWLRPWRRLLGRATSSDEAPQTIRPAEQSAGSPRPETTPVAELTATGAQGAPAPAVEEPAFMAPEDAFRSVTGDALPDQEELEVALNLDANLGIEDEPAPGFAAEPDPVLEPELIAMGEPEPVEMAEDDLMALDDEAEDGAGAVGDDSAGDEHARAVGEAGGPDDLLIIEGIGPRVSTIVSAAGITSFAELADAGEERLRTVLTDAGIKNLNPATWPEQARLADEGRWDELKELQQRIKNGKLEE